MLVMNLWASQHNYPFTNHFLWASRNLGSLSIQIKTQEDMFVCSELLKPLRSQELQIVVFKKTFVFFHKCEMA